MIDRLKSLLAVFKDIFWYITVPIGSLIGYIIYLRGNLSATQDKLAESKASKELAETLTKKGNAHEESENAVKEFDHLVSDYLKRGGK